MTREKVYKLIDGELDYAQYWDERRKAEKNPKFDKDKDVETWIAWMLVDLNRALQAAYASINKEEALNYVRKATGLGVSCMIHNDTPARK